MSPALIDTRKPPSSSSTFPQNPNPKNSTISEHPPSKFMSGFDYNFASPSEPKFRSVSSNRPIPRLVKVRKQGGSGSSRGRSRSIATESLDFNPFIRNDSEQGSVHVADGSRFQELFEKYDSNSNSEDFDSSGKYDDLGFVFGATLNLNSHLEKTAISEQMLNLNIGKKDDGFSSNVKNVKKNVFVFGSSDNNSNNLNVDENEGFKLEDEIRKLNIKSFGNVEGGNTNKFVFGSRGSEGSVLNKDVDSKLPDRMQNLNIKETMNEVKFNPMGSNRNSFVFGSNGNASSVLPNAMKNLNIEETTGDHVKADTADVFVFGSMKKDIGSSSQTSIGVLPDEMSKLNMGSEIRNASVSQDTTPSSSFSSQTTGNVEANTTNAFVSGSYKKDIGFSGRTFIGVMPEEMSKLNMGSEIRNASASHDTTPSSSFGKQPKGSSDKLFNDVGIGNSTTGSFSFQSTKPSKSPSAGPLHSDQQNSDAKSSGDSTSSQSFYSAGLSFLSSAGSDHSVQQKAESKYGGASLYSFHSADRTFQSSKNIFEEPNANEAGNKAESDFATSHMEFRTPMQDASFSSTSNTFSGLQQMLEFSAKKATTNDTRSVKKKRGKTRKSVQVPLWVGQHEISSENSFQENAESSACYSPMDVSPYHETSFADESSRGASVTSLDATDEDLITATETLNVKEDGATCEESKEESMDNFDKSVRGDEFVSGLEHQYVRSKMEPDTRNDASFAATERDSGVHSHVENKGNDGSMEFGFTSTSENICGRNFTFSASTSAQEHASAVKRQYKKKNRLKSGQDSYVSTLNSKLQFAPTDIPFSPLPGRTSNPVMEQNRQGDSSLFQFMEEKKTETKEQPKGKQDSTSKASSTAVAHEACEKWRLRGNQAYANGNLSKAEDYYTRGLNCVRKNETSEACLTALTLCYSNRAAARMSSGRIRAALDDCKKAAEINPDFRKVQVRAANCYLALGEIEDALRVFKSVLPPGADLCLDRKLVIEASNGLQKAERAHEYYNRCGELLRQRASGDAERALQILAEALLISPYSEKLVEMKAEALLLLRKYEEVLQTCEQSLDFADKNSSPSGGSSEGIKNFSARLWRWHLMAKSNFYLGKLEEALTFLEKLEQAESVTLKVGSKTAESSSTLAVTVRELLHHKAAGNEAFQSGRHSEAVEHYTSALSCNLESRPFAAICFCNRAAAHQALGQIADAIADCSLAIALDANYPKAISRRATLHEMIRDYSQAAVDLQRLVSLLETQTDEKSNKSGTLSRSTSGNLDLRQAHTRLSTVEEESRKGISLNFYLILGIESAGVATDIKKAYRKSALRHHPDKAAQVLPRSENGDDGVWKEIVDVVYKDADRLFKMIGEAYAVLSDPVKRFQYDEEELRFTKKSSGCSTSRAHSDMYNSPFDRSDSRRPWQEVRRSYRTHYSQYADASRSERYF